MKYDMTPEDHQTIAHDLAHDRTLKHLRNLSFYKFTVGDVLVREEKWRKSDGGDGWEWKVRMADANLPYKYVYVFENELGVGYIRRLSVNGRKFVERPLCVTEFDPDQTRFSLDPEYADHMLLSAEDEEFDTKTRYADAKKKREKIHRQNKKIAVPLPDEAAALAWMQTLKVGDQLWYGYGISSIHKEPYFVHEINLNPPPAVPAKSQPASPYNYGYNRVEQFAPHIKIGAAAPGVGNAYSSPLYVHSITRYYVFMQRPTFFEEVIN